MAAKRHRLAAIDVGTNSVHMIVVEALRRGFRVIDKEKEMVQLGRGSLAGKPLTEAAMKRGVDALTRMGEIARRYRVDEIMCVATSATREAPNADEFVRRAEESSGIHIRVIQGEEEADYIWRAVRSSVDFRGGSVLCIDIGGGSVELIVGTMEQVFFTRSEPIGALRLTQQFFAEGDSSDRSVWRCRRFVRRRLRKAFTRVRSIGFDLVVGTSGTITTLAELAGASADVAAGLRPLDRADLRQLISRLASVPAEQRAEEFKIDPLRAATILAGAVILDEILDLSEADSLLACSAALREGLVLRALDERRVEPGPRGDVRRSSVLDLAERSGINRAHALHVAKLATRLFDQMSALHKLRPLERELLEYAAILGEIGQQVSWQSYHKHSYYMIRHAGLHGFTEEEVSVIANVARYHRKGKPKERHENIRELSDKQVSVVRKLISILRVAHALDRSKRQAVRDVAVDVNGDAIGLSLRPRLDIDVELARVGKASRFMGETFSRQIDIEVQREGRS